MLVNRLDNTGLSVLPVATSTSCGWPALPLSPQEVHSCQKVDRRLMLTAKMNKDPVRLWTGFILHLKGLFWIREELYCIRQVSVKLCPPGGRWWTDTTPRGNGITPTLKMRQAQSGNNVERPCMYVSTWVDQPKHAIYCDSSLGFINCKLHKESVNLKTNIKKFKQLGPHLEYFSCSLTWILQVVTTVVNCCKLILWAVLFHIQLNANLLVETRQ